MEDTLTLQQPEPVTEAQPEPVDNAETIPAEPTAKTESTAEEFEQAEKQENHDIRRMKKFIQRAAVAEAEAAALRAQIQGSGQQAQAPGPLQREQFGSEEAYLSAMVQQEVAKAVPALTQQLQMQQQASKSKEAIQEIRAQHDDYDEVMSDALNIPVTQALQEALLSSPMLEQLKYHLAKNPDKVEELASMSPTRVAAEIGRLEAKLENQSKPAPRPVSKAKAPITPVKVQGASGRVDESKLSDQDWFKLDLQRRMKKR
jgi:hypothetical protein